MPRINVSPNVEKLRKCPRCRGSGFVPYRRRKQDFMVPEIQKIIDDANAASALVDQKDQQIASLQKQIADLKNPPKPKLVTLSSIQTVAPKQQYWYEARSAGDPKTGPHGTATILSGEPAVVDFHPVNLGGPSDNVYLPREMYATLSPDERLLLETATKFSIACTWLVDNWAAPQALELDYQIRKSSGVLINIGLQFIPLGGSWTLRGFDYVGRAWISMIGGITPKAGVPIAVKIEATCDDKVVQFTQATVDAKVMPVTLSHPVSADTKGSPYCRAAYQLDGRANATPYKATIGKLTVTFA